MKNLNVVCVFVVKVKPPIQPDLKDALDTSNFYPIEEDGSAMDYTVSTLMTF